MKQIFDKNDLKKMFESRGQIVKKIKIDENGLEVTQVLTAEAMKNIMLMMGTKVNTVEFRNDGIVIDADVPIPAKKG